MLKSNDHLMIDIETVDNTMTSAILSIAAVPWNPETGRYDKDNYFYKVIRLQTCFDLGLTAGGQTLAWWLKQDNAARMSALGLDEKSNVIHEQVSLVSALNQLKNFITEYQNLHIIDKDAKFKVWGNGARFDLGILDNAYKACKIKLPWNFRNERDVRTLVSIKPPKTKAAFDGVKHNPVDDCIYQIKYCSKIWRSIHGKSKKEISSKATQRKKIKPNL